MPTGIATSPSTTLLEYDSIIRNQIHQGIVEVVEHSDHSEIERVHMP